MEIIPAIDIIEGQCVRLSKGNYDNKTIYSSNPIEVAKRFEAAGLKRLHLVDLDGAKAGSVKNWKVLETIATQTSLYIDFGGGIANSADVRTALNAGAMLIAAGSIAIKNKTEFSSWLIQFEAERFLLAADVNNRTIAVKGWTETSNVTIHEFVEYWLNKGITQIFCTDISKDGMLEGPSIKLYHELVKTYPTLNLIASGGVTTVSDLDELKRIGCKGAIVGKAIYEGRILLEDLKTFTS